MSRQSPNHASWVPTVGGDLLSYVNLLSFIKEFARAHEISNYSYFEFGILNGESVIASIRQLRGEGFQRYLPLIPLRGYQN